MPVHVVIVPVVSRHNQRTPARVADQHAAARRALIESAQLSGAPESGYDADTNGAPRPNADWHWSIAHKRRFAAAAVSRAPVGVDVEEIRPRDPATFAEIAAEAEWSLLPARDESALFRMWTAKEAVTKALAAGMAAFDDCRLTHVCPACWRLAGRGREWTVVHHLHAGHVFAVAAASPDVQWYVRTAH